MGSPYASGTPAGGGGSYAGSPYTSGTPGAPAKAKGHGGVVGSIKRYSGAELVGNLLSDTGATAVGLFPGLYQVGKATALDANDAAHLRAPTHLEKIGGQIVAQYRDYYGHDLLHHLYQHPLQPLLDTLTVATGGLGAAAKVADVVAPGSRLASLAERGTVATRSPRALYAGKGPTRVDLTSAKPAVQARERLANARRKAGPGAKRPGGTLGFGTELKQYGQAIRQDAQQAALGRAIPIDAYHRATRGLSDREWVALHIRSFGVHPDQLAQVWKGTPDGALLADPRVRGLVLGPSKKILRAEPVVARFSEQGADLLREVGRLSGETELLRPNLAREQVARTLEEPHRPIPGGPEPYYVPHVVEPVKGRTPLQVTGGGKGIPRVPGTSKQNLAVLLLRGRLHLRSDVLGPEFLRRVKYIQYDETHRALLRGAVPQTAEQLGERGGLPSGWEYVREKPKAVTMTRTVSAEADPNQLLIPGAPGATKTVSKRVQLHPSVPFSARAETDQALRSLIPNPDELRTSTLADGFTTTDPALARGHERGVYWIVPKATAKAATGEFVRSSDFVHNWIHRPLSVWRALVLGLRVGFLTNNLVGNSVLYAVKTGGAGAIRDLFGALVETHGKAVAKKALDSSATPPAVRADLYREFFPEQARGTFGLTQSPSTALGAATGKARAITGAIPSLTSKIAEETPRRALIRHFVRTSPEFKTVYKRLPREARTFEDVARQLLEGTGGKAYQRQISREVNNTLGDYLNLTHTERAVLRNTLPFYAWYRAIVTVTYHLAADTPLRANILGQIGQIGRQQASELLPSFLQGAIGLGHGPNGTTRVLSTQGLNPYATLEQVRRGALTDVTDAGLNPFVQAIFQQAARGKVAPSQLLLDSLTGIVRGLPPASVAFPLPPSKLYPNRDRQSNAYSFLGAPVKEYNPAEAAKQAKAGR